jgi:hypothetical protein
MTRRSLEERNLVIERPHLIGARAVVEPPSSLTGICRNQPPIKRPRQHASEHTNGYSCWVSEKCELLSKLKLAVRSQEDYNREVPLAYMSALAGKPNPDIATDLGPDFDLGLLWARAYDEARSLVYDRTINPAQDEKIAITIARKSFLGQKL